MATIGEVLRCLVSQAPNVSGSRDDFLDAIGDFEHLVEDVRLALNPPRAVAQPASPAPPAPSTG